ncbi:NFX1-type zinc finger-containing protein 1-like [Watersipora subatra]|uniref:NFX1-type zinc finger-containing protein 1-like n=1 Tax=Watersipora subatra TaxID=2589382 RepID=UPI00355B099D
MFQRTRWTSAKRLIFGSLLCLSQDGFDKISLFAVVTDRDEIEKAGEFRIEFLPDSQRAFDQLANKKTPFIAVESTAYFESYKHVLKGIQELSESEFAFAKHIVRVETDVAPPAYTSMEMLYRFIAADKEVTKLVSVFRNCKNWPSAEELGFNESQFEAYKMALTKEFAVIQGPPGTGKTFIGLKIVEMLLDNLYGISSTDQETTDSGLTISDRTMSWRERRPKRLNQVLIVCYTNHALDQFLEGMLKFCSIEDMVRVGSRSKSERLESCNLKKRTTKSTGQLGISFFQYREELHSFINGKTIEKALAEMKSTKEAILMYEHPGLFEDFPEFFSQLAYYAAELKDQNKDGDAMVHWLNIDSATDLEESPEMKQESGSMSPTSRLSEDFIEIEGDRELASRKLDLDDDDDDDDSEWQKSSSSTRSSGKCIIFEKI